jgi:peptidase E
LNLVLTSDFPSTVTDVLLRSIRNVAENPRVAWIPPQTSVGRERFPTAQTAFQSLGISALEFCDIDDEPNAEQLTHLEQYDVLYLTGGDPLLFRKNIERSGLSRSLRACLAAGRVICAASGGAMQLTANVSLYRLLSESVDAVVEGRPDYAGLGFADYELLPHFDKLDAAFVENVRRYSEKVPCDIVALEDGAAIIHRSSGAFRCIGGAVRFRGGVRNAIEAA